MKEKILSNRKNGFAALILVVLLYALAFVLTIKGGTAIDAGKSGGVLMLVLGIVWICVGWIPALGFKILKPQEALVLTLFGKYVGTLKEEGFYFVNPFCGAVNPAANTKLSQSGDVDSSSGTNPLTAVLTNGKLTVKHVSAETKTIEPPKLHNITSIQREANEQFGYPAELTTGVLQGLYERKHISYPRTSSRHVTEDVFNSILPLIERMKNTPLGDTIPQWPEKGNENRGCINPEKVSDHHALVITGNFPVGSKDYWRIDLSEGFQSLYMASVVMCNKNACNIVRNFFQLGNKVISYLSRVYNNRILCHFIYDNIAV